MTDVVGATVAAVDDAVGAEQQRLLREVEGRALLDVFRTTVAAHRDQPALVAARPDGSFRTRTWGEYEDEANRVAMALRRLGVGHGDFVALMVTNRPEHVIADIGVLLAGATPVSVYNTLAADQVAYVAGNCDAKVAIVEDAASLATWQRVRDQLPNLEHLVVIEGAGVDTSPSDVTTYELLLADGAQALAGGRGELANAWRSVRPDDPLTLIYTSGTTGPPKGVVITHRNLLFQLQVTREMLDVQPGQRSVSYLPLAHIAERMATHYLAILYAGTVAYVRDLQDLLPTLLQARPQSLMAVPRVWEKMHVALRAGDRRGGGRTSAEGRPEGHRGRHPGRRPGDARSARPAPPAPPAPPLRPPRVRQDPREARVRPAALRALGRGADQHRPADLLRRHRHRDPRGLRHDGVDRRHHRQPAGTGADRDRRPGRARHGGPHRRDGEILARGPHITPGYWRRDEATAEAIDADGWLHTGDLGVLDEDGFLRIVGREKELIITAGGKNLSPNNIEETIRQRSMLIGQLCAVGDDRPYIGALIVLDAEMLPLWCYQQGVEFTSVEAAAQEPAVLAEVERAIAEGNEQLARVEQVRRWTIVPSEWTAESEELTPSLKLKRRVIHDKYADVIDELYAKDA